MGITFVLPLITVVFSQVPVHNQSHQPPWPVLSFNWLEIWHECDLFRNDTLPSKWQPDKLLSSPGSLFSFELFRKVMDFLENSGNRTLQSVCKFVYGINLLTWPGRWHNGQWENVEPLILHNEIASCCSLFQVKQVTVPLNFFYVWPSCCRGQSNQNLGEH